MISKDEVKKLAALSRLELSNEEMESYEKDLNNILNYVAEVQAVGVSEEIYYDETVLNTMREDLVLNETGSNTEKLLKAVPETQDGYVKVKRIL